MNKRLVLGYTLIELLIVVFIISISLGFIILRSDSNSTNKQVLNAAKQLTAIIKLAQQQATLQQTVIGLQITNNSYHFLQLNSKNNWQPLNARDTLWQSHNFGKDLIIASHINTKNSNIIIFSPSGELTPFNITLQDNTARSVYQIVGNEAGEVTLLHLGQPI